MTASISALFLCASQSFFSGNKYLIFRNKHLCKHAFIGYITKMFELSKPTMKRMGFARIVVIKGANSVSKTVQSILLARDRAGIWG